jgi:hypothetical protein
LTRSSSGELRYHRSCRATAARATWRQRASGARHAAVSRAWRRRPFSAKHQRQRSTSELTAKLERDGDPDVVAKARQLLADMEQTLARLQAEYAAAQERLAQATVDEPGPSKPEARRCRSGSTRGSRPGRRLTDGRFNPVIPAGLSRPPFPPRCVPPAQRHRAHQRSVSRPCDLEALFHFSGLGPALMCSSHSQYSPAAPTMPAAAAIQWFQTAAMR